MKLDEAPLKKEIVREKLRRQVLSLRSDTYMKIPSERALSEKMGVSRLSIRAAIKDLSAEGLLVQMQGKGTYITPLVKMRYLSILCPSDIKSNDPYYNKLLVEMTNEAAKRSININMVDSNNPLPVQSGTPLIVLGILEDSLPNSLTSSYTPVITTQEYPFLQDIIQVSFDNYKIGCDAARILYELNHRKVLHLAGPERFPSAFYRRKGFLDASKKLGLHAEIITGKMNWAEGYKLGELYHQEFGEADRATAVFAANDWMAAGFMKRLQEAGINIPGDVSVLGCDNIQLAAEYSPAISTFDLDEKHLAAEIFSILDENKQPPIPVKGKRIMLSATPVLRQSTGERQVTMP